MLMVPAINAEEVGKMQSFEDPAVKAEEVACASHSKSPVKEQASMMIAGSNLGLQWPSLDCAMEAVKSLERDFLAKIRAEVNRIIFFWLGLKVNVSSGIRRRFGRVLSRLGLKPKLLFGDKWRGEAQGLWADCEAQAQALDCPCSVTFMGSSLRRRRRLHRRRRSWLWMQSLVWRASSVRILSLLR
jgi:hypothetical protein